MVRLSQPGFGGGRRMIVMRTLVRLFAVWVSLAGSLVAADLTGIWMGEVPGRNGEKQDLAFRFQTVKGEVTGVMFGDEFDLPVQELRVEGERISFSVTNVNFYDGKKVRTIYSGVLTGKTLELTKEQAKAADPGKPKEANPVIVLKRLG